MERKPTTAPRSRSRWMPGLRQRRWHVVWTALIVLSLATVWATIGSTPTIFHLTAVTEEVRIYTSRDTATSALVFNRVLLAQDDARIPLDDAQVPLSDGALIRLQRVSGDTLVIAVEADPDTGAVGTVYRHGRVDRVLGPDALFLVPLSGERTEKSFLLSFRARRLVVGDIPGLATDQRTPLMRSGQVTLRGTTLWGGDFESHTYTLRTGERVDLPPAGKAAIQPGSGTVLAEGGVGMTVNFTIRAPEARVFSDGSEEKLSTGALDRMSEHPVIAIGWLLLVPLVLTPVGSVIADRMKSRTETLLTDHENSSVVADRGRHGGHGRRARGRRSRQ